MDFRKDFGLKLREYRAMKGLTQEQLVAKINIAVPTLSGFENGKAFPSYPVLCKIIEALDTTPESLFTFGSYSKSLADKEQELKIIELFSALNKHNRVLALQLLQCLINNQK